ncbi:unnamed protein product [Notodromas monacha]|uniref:Sulfotransferase domain-containing protein n=1 Tax=Notodromas monacha TaxID=399045 RepID=A0A7R9BH11_9CRUS|nr:unnamed protein product [Notodromas monacha]CAG0913952.1 unnamed protein product [Notodromas monacha]
MRVKLFVIISISAAFILTVVTEWKNSFASRIWSFSPKLPTQRVLVVATGRSGSSFVGSMLEFGENVSYLFEPLWFHRYTISEKREHNLPLFETSLPVNQITLDETIETFEAAFNCDIGYFRSLVRKQGRSAATWFQKYVRPFSKTCQSQNPIVIKVIRLLVTDDFLSWVNHPTNDVGIIFLIRDPRGVYNSRLQQPPSEKFSFDMDGLCSRVFLDYEVLQKYARDKLLIVRYEDVAANPQKELERMYDFLHWKVTEAVLESLGSHISNKSENSENIPKYFSTYRDLNSFDPMVTPKRLAVVSSVMLLLLFAFTTLQTFETREQRLIPVSTTTQAVPVTRNSANKRVLVVAEARSGSSFISRLIASRENTSFFFEPLYFLKEELGLSKQFPRQNQMNYSHDRSLDLVIPDDNEKALKSIKAALDCDIMVKVIRYEDVVNDANSYLRSIYSFLSWSVTDEVNDALRRQFYFRRKMLRQRSVQKWGSWNRIASPESWKSELPTVIAEKIASSPHCKEWKRLAKDVVAKNSQL